MSLYYEAATILSSTTSESGSLKSVVYNTKQSRKSQPATLYALITEAAKWDQLLKEVIENANLLTFEPKLSPVLALLLTHDLLLSKRGIAAPAKHPLRTSIERNKARLQAEFTKARLRRKCTSVEELRKKLLAEKDDNKQGTPRPRWVRVNTVVSDLKSQLDTTFSKYEQTEDLNQLSSTGLKNGIILDQHIPDLVAIPPTIDLTTTSAYKTGEIILQDKASCFPAYLLLESKADYPVEDIIDGCAAPGNKTTHLAALVAKRGGKKKHGIFGCERDTERSKTLQKMVDVAGAGKMIKVLGRQDFLALDPDQPEFTNVTHLLLDPSCSGSGILGREDIPQLSLPIAPKGQPSTAGNGVGSKKRKRGPASGPTQPEQKQSTSEQNGGPSDADINYRLERLAGLQLRIIEHAFAFPSATKITYSTCSIHVTENENVVARALRSKVAQERGWKVLLREDHPEGLKAWKHRGIEGDHDLNKAQMEGCIRCYPNDEFGTMGFFVCGFVRDQAHVPESEPANGHEGDTVNGKLASAKEAEVKEIEEAEDEEDEWEGFSDT